MEYATARLIVEASDEIREGRLDRLIEHGLELAQAREYIRQNQDRLIVEPILAHLRSGYPQQAAVENQLLALLPRLAALSDDAQGYGPANLVALLRSQWGDLRGLDLSRLALRGGYLQGVEMQDATLSGTLIQDCVFTETFGAVTAVAISSSGTYWAASSQRGEIRVWAAGSLTLHRVWRAHADLVRALVFSPDERTLFSGSWDGTVKLWDVASGALLWSGEHMSQINSVAFAPGGSMLASSGNDATVRLWDLQNGTQIQALPHPGLVLAVA